MFKNIIQKKKNNKTNNKTLVLQKYQPTFTTIDGNTHIGYVYNWADLAALNCSISEFIMCNINSDGYIYDENYVMYILNNIISMEWNKVEEISIPDNFYHEYKVCFTDKEVLKVLEKNKKE